MKDKEAIRKWLDGLMTPEERAAFEQTEDFQFVSKLTDALRKFKAPDYPVEEELKRQHTNRPPRQSVQRRSYWIAPALKIAAVVLLVAVAAFWVLIERPFTDERIKISSLEREEVLLPDSSFVALNKHSSIVFTKEDWTERRNVLLEGEAYFVVKRGQQFDVITDGGKVSVLGTRFNVKHRPNYFEVTCYEGKVAIQTRVSKDIILRPGQQYRVINGEVFEQDLADSPSPSWTENRSTFVSVPIAEVLREFERQYDVVVRYNKLDTSRLFTGSFTHEDRIVALKSIAIPLSLDYRINQDEIVLIE